MRVIVVVVVVREGGGGVGSGGGYFIQWGGREGLAGGANYILCAACYRPSAPNQAIITVAPKRTAWWWGRPHTAVLLALETVFVFFVSVLGSYPFSAHGWHCLEVRIHLVYTAVLVSAEDTFFFCKHLGLLPLFRAMLALLGSKDSSSPSSSAVVAVPSVTAVSRQEVAFRLNYVVVGKGCRGMPYFEWSSA